MYWLRRSYATEGEKVVVLALTACLFSSVIVLTDTKHTPSRTDLADTDARTMGLERSETKSQTKRNTRRRHRHKNRKQRNRIPLLKEIDPSLISNLVRFSPTRPHSPPFPYPVSFIDEKEESVLKLALHKKDDLNERRSNVTDIVQERQRRSVTSAVKRKNKNRNKRDRRKRSKRRDMSVPVCTSSSRWVQRTDAEDMWGNSVKVAQHIPSGNSMINQYFYETFCRRQEPAPCYGIDSERFDSLCENKYIWTYARIINSFGEEGWNLIKIRGSCNCALFRKKGTRRGLLSLL
ncbi:unnamed protein product [Owenia fusiformis]|uniref:Nerve growth factor-related domain-containing protein n=1 Tax=Owenia fusiformis TaxID=6347 RepID=A0A8S4Q0P2_OWEFU|nr:unnamed protein product [Owenia fusiformis]